jgi:outer membrane protein OmpA-like peptidoglycan-associated protein
MEDSMASVLDAITGLVNPQLVSQIAGRLGEPEANVQRGMQTSATAVLAALASKAGDGNLMRTVLDTAKRFASDPAATASAAIGDATAGGDSTTSPATGLLSSLFGGGTTTALSTAIGSASGLRPESASSLLPMSVPLVLGWLGKRANQEGMDASGLGAWLARERDTLVSALPAGLRTLLGASSPSMPNVDIPKVGIPGAASMPSISKSRNWMPAALVGLLAVLLIGYFTLRHKPANTVVAQNGAIAVNDSLHAAAAPVVADSSAASGMVHEAIPGGVDLTVAPNGIEARLIQFVKDSSARVNDTTWFNFDRLLFETGSATLKPESQAQLKSVAQILQAYPNVKARIGGYTDNSGDAAANMQLSESRAQNVRAELEKLGVAGDRLDAKGYGAEHPVGDNATAEGRAANRRIALRVTAK